MQVSKNHEAEMFLKYINNQPNKAPQTLKLFPKNKQIN